MTIVVWPEAETTVVPPGMPVPEIAVPAETPVKLETPVMVAEPEAVVPVGATVAVNLRRRIDRGPVAPRLLGGACVQDDQQIVYWAGDPDERTPSCRPGCHGVPQVERRGGRGTPLDRCRTMPRAQAVRDGGPQLQDDRAVSPRCRSVNWPLSMWAATRSPSWSSASRCRTPVALSVSVIWVPPLWTAAICVPAGMPVPVTVVPAMGVPVTPVTTGEPRGQRCP